MFQIKNDLPVEKVRQDIESMKWFHSFTIAPDIVVKGIEDTPSKLKALNLPEDMTGMRVLVIDANDGFFAFECERRGAKEVFATESWEWNPEHDAAFDRFLYLKKLLKSKVSQRPMDHRYISRSADFFVDKGIPFGEFDLILLLGVLHRTVSPLRFLFNLCRMTKKLLVIETLVDCLHIQRPAMAYYPRDLLAQDGNNQFGPNLMAVAHMLRDAGFPQVTCFGLWYKNVITADSLPFTVKEGESGRAVFHAEMS